MFTACLVHFKVMIFNVKCTVRKRSLITALSDLLNKNFNLHNLKSQLF